MGRLNNALTALQTSLTNAGLTAVTDPRKVRPGVVLIDPSNIEVSSINGAQLLLEFPVVCMAPPPGNIDALTKLNDLADVVIDAVPATSARAGSYAVGGQELPCITVTVHWPASN